MQDITELERRVAAALDRIGRSLDGMPVARALLAHTLAPLDEQKPSGTGHQPAGDEQGGEPGAKDLAAALAAARSEAADLRTRVAAQADREAVLRSQAEERIEKLTRQLDVQGLELQRMRKSAVTLREDLRRLRETQTEGLADPHLINRAMMAELDALRATRLTELAELDELSAALDDHLTEAEHA